VATEENRGPEEDDCLRFMAGIDQLDEPVIVLARFR
jgi:hypothetical protein